MPSDVELPNNPISWPIVSDTPESLWPELILVAEAVVDRLSIDVDLLVLPDGKDIERWPAVPELVPDILRVEPKFPDSAFRMVPTQTVPVDQQRIARLYPFEIPLVPFPVSLLWIGPNIPHSSYIRKFVGLFVLITEIDGVSERLLERWFVDGDEPELCHTLTVCGRTFNFRMTNQSTDRFPTDEPY